MTATGQAAVLKTPGSAFTVETVAIGDPRPGEVRVRIEAVGICHTDLVFATGELGTPFPLILGHEGAGVIDKIGEGVTGLAPGDKVLLTFDSCGRCPRCEDGLPSYCRHFTDVNYACQRGDGSSPAQDRDGPVAARFFGQSSFSRYAISTQRNTVKLPPDADLGLLAPLGCGVQTGVGGVLHSLGARPGSSLAVIGGGAVGLSAIMGGVLAECATIILIEPRPERRELGTALGATHVIDPRADNAAEAVRAIRPEGVDHVFDTSGVPDAITGGLAMLAPYGTLGLVGVPHSLDAAIALPIVPTITYGHTIKGIVEGDSDPQRFLPELVRLVREGKLPIGRLITRYPFERINEAIADTQTGTCVKPVLIFPSDS